MSPARWPPTSIVINRGAHGIRATDRVRLFKLAWDLAGDAFGMRAERDARVGQDTRRGRPLGPRTLAPG
ncbi:MAG: hypothetical protein KAY46_02010 [Burkholderiaceae bacterium]|nr:hypothetical protein [Burkholderiaceae bacterium]